jgi:hypothetical protein
MSAPAHDPAIAQKRLASQADIVKLCQAYCATHDVPMSCVIPSNHSRLEDVSDGQALCESFAAGVGVGEEGAVAVRTAGGAREQVVSTAPARPSPTARRCAPVHDGRTRRGAAVMASASSRHAVVTRAGGMP